MAHEHHHDGHEHTCGCGEGCGCEGGHADLSGPAGSPILVEVARGGLVESVHRGRACIVDSHGHLVAGWGDIKAPVFPRSTVKPLQAIPLVETGALDAFKLTDAELALACASHNGEPRHTRTVAAWLDRIGCTVDDLECGPQIPADPEAAAELIRQGEASSALHNNCSGKHAGFLATAKHRGERIKGYIRFDHAVQQRVLGVLEQMTGQDLSLTPWGVDGCGIPTFSLPLEAVAFAMARLGDPRDLPDRRAEAAARIRLAWAAHPYLIGGQNSFDTELVRIANGLILLKSGAEGMGVAVLPRQGLGIALKIDDGNARARDVAMAALLKSTDALSADHWARVPQFLSRPILNAAGREVGLIRPADGWPVREDAAE
jgi:L-asparaginase II